MLVIIPSLGYADFLAVTLPAWRRTLPRATFVVVTASGDRETLRVVHENGLGPLLTDAWHRDGAEFNKAGALDAALTCPVTPPHREVCLVLDADVYPGGPFPDEGRLEAGVLYGAPRYDCPTPDVLRAHLSGALSREQLALILPRVKGEEKPRLQLLASPHDAHAAGRRTLGYLQCFRYAGQSFGQSQTAGGYDNRFARQFHRREALPGGFYVLHLGEQDRRNWRGRVVPQWGAA